MLGAIFSSGAASPNRHTHSPPLPHPQLPPAMPTRTTTYVLVTEKGRQLQRCTEGPAARTERLGATNRARVQLGHERTECTGAECGSARHCVHLFWLVALVLMISCLAHLGGRQLDRQGGEAGRAGSRDVPAQRRGWAPVWQAQVDGCPPRHLARQLLSAAPPPQRAALPSAASSSQRQGLVEEHGRLDTPCLALAAYQAPVAHAADAGVVKHEPAAGVRHQHQRLVVRAVVADHGAQGVAVQAGGHTAVHLPHIHLHGSIRGGRLRGADGVRAGKVDQPGLSLSGRCAPRPHPPAALLYGWEMHNARLEYGT